MPVAGDSPCPEAMGASLSVQISTCVTRQPGPLVGRNTQSIAAPTGLAQCLSLEGVEEVPCHGRGLGAFFAFSGGVARRNPCEAATEHPVTFLRLPKGCLQLWRDIGVESPSGSPTHPSLVFTLRAHSRAISATASAGLPLRAIQQQLLESEPPLIPATGFLRPTSELAGFAHAAQAGARLGS